MTECQMYPGATWHPLGRQTEDPMRAHDIVCVHTMVGYLTSTEDLFERDGYGGTESHYGIGGKWGGDAARGLDGAVRQWQDRRYTADANLNGGPRVLSVETADNAPRDAADLERWTPAQAAALVELLAWECSPAAHRECPSSWDCHEFGIPPFLIQDTKRGRRGLAMHRQGVEHSAGVGKVPGYLVDGGERWSNAVGKECPGDRRARQFVDEIVPAVRRKLLTGGTDMALTDAELDRIARAVWGVDVVRNLNAPEGSRNPVWTPRTALEQADEKHDRAAAALAATRADVAKLSGQVQSLAGVVAQLAAGLKAVPPGSSGPLSPADVDRIVAGVLAEAAARLGAR